MSICDQIKDRFDKQELFLLDPQLPGSSVVRKLYVVQDLYGFFETRQSDQRQERCRNDLRADLDYYINGSERSVRLNYRKGSASNLARLRPASGEVWEFQVRGKEPQMRAFGRFACKDVFVAFFWKLHDELKNKQQWNEAVVRCQQEWAQLFSSTQPHSGVKACEYISNAVPV
jgi:hypothetical protein